MGLAMLLVGALYDAAAGQAFLVMAALSAAGGLLALFLWRQHRRAAEPQFSPLFS